MDSNRLIFNNTDTSASVPQSSKIVGFSVIRASKGSQKPQFVSAGDTNTLLDLFGAPSANIGGTVYSYSGVKRRWTSSLTGTLYGCLLLGEYTQAQTQASEVYT